MNFRIDIPFAKINFSNAEDRHKKYFSNLFFQGSNLELEEKFTILVEFTKIRLNGSRSFLEEDTIAQNGKLIILDTKKNKLEIDSSDFRTIRIKLKVEKDFDLYYLYNYVLEPLAIIWSAFHGVLYIHSSAFYKNGAYIFPAWRHAGKTSSIFSLANEKIEFLADDFCVLRNGVVYLYPKYINIFSYNFQQYPWLYNHLPTFIALRIKISVHFKKLLTKVSQLTRGPLSKVFYRLSELAEISTNTKITPQMLGMKVCKQGKLKQVVFITKSNKNSKKLVELSQEEIRQKLLTITNYEINDFLMIYAKHKYFFPTKQIKQIEEFKENYLKATDSNLQNAKHVQITPKIDKDFYKGLLRFPK